MAIDFESTWRPAMHIIGLEARTSNAREAEPSTSVIGAVWQRYFEDAFAARIPHVVDASVLYAVYTCYASDADGEYSFILGRSVDEHAVAPEGMTKARLPPGSYVVGTAPGEGRDAVVRGWQAVWEYFARPDAPQRSYTADIEVHRTEVPGEVEIYVAVR